MNLSRILRSIQIQKSRDMDKRGMQPLMAYTCFYALKTKKTEDYCEQCPNYRQTCYLYLKACEIPADPFAETRKKYAKLLEAKT